MISDVPNDDPAVIGSGLLFTSKDEMSDLPALPKKWSDRIRHNKRSKPSENFSWKIIASLSDAKKAAAKKAPAKKKPADKKDSE